MVTFLSSAALLEVANRLHNNPPAAGFFDGSLDRHGSPTHPLGFTFNNAEVSLSRIHVSTFNGIPRNSFQLRVGRDRVQGFFIDYATASDSATRRAAIGAVRGLATNRSILEVVDARNFAA